MLLMGICSCVSEKLLNTEPSTRRELILLSRLDPNLLDLLLLNLVVNLSILQDKLTTITNLDAILLSLDRRLEQDLVQRIHPVRVYHVRSYPVSLLVANHSLSSRPVRWE